MLEFRILGPLEVCRREQPLRLPGSASRRVLAALAVSRGAWVSTDRLIDELWPGGAPASGRKALQMHITRLRRALAALADPKVGAVLASGPAGYRLEIAPEQVDAARFERLVEEGHGALAASEPERARRLLVTALALWRGPPLAELSLQGETAAEARRLEELQLVALEHRIEADLQLGRHADVIGELQRMIGQHEWRERLHAQLMLALYRAGRQADALQVYRHAREVLVEQLGLEPGPELRDLERAILGHDASLRPAAPPSGLLTAPPPALRTGALPAPPTRLIGRGRERRELARLLADRDIRLVTLVGPGGVGKTRLALAAASDAQAAFRDGVHWVELAAVARPEHVASSIARALAITPLSGETGENALIRFLAPKRLLLTIDNFEHLVAAAPLIAQLLADCPALTVLATSRQALDLRAEHCYPVMLLAVPSAPERATEIELEQTEATALFLDAARRQGSALKVTGNAPAIAELCARLDGLPLALELAAAHTTIMGPEQLAARLDRALSELASRARDVPERQRTLRATLEWSHRLLAAEERDSFARFGVFAGGATLNAAQAVTEASIDALTGLAAKQLLYRDDTGGEPRLAILETVRTFALERLADRPDAAAVARRHCEYYLALAELRDPTPFVDPQPEWLATLDRDIDNLRAALSWALANDPDAALKLAPSLGEYWVHRSSIDEGLRALHGVLEAAGPDAPVRDLARIQSLRADLFWRTDDVQAAEEAACNSLRMAQAAADHAGIALALSHLVVAALLQGRRDEAREHGREALRQARAAHDDRLTANALAWLAPCLPWEQGRPVYDEAVTLLTRVGNQRFLCVLHSNMAFAAMREDRNEEASALLDEAMRLAVQLDDAWTMTSCLGNVGLNALLSGDHERAREAFANQLRISRSQGFHAHAGEGLVGLAAIAATEHDPARAARLLGAAIRVSPVGVPWIEQVVEERFIARAREALSSSAWCASTDAGGQMTFADAIGYALEGSDK